MANETGRYAEDLATAGPKDVIVIDRRGDVVSHRGRRLRWGIYYGALAILLSLEALAGYELFGVPGLGIAASLGLLVGWRVLLNARMVEAVRAAVALDLDRAEKLFESILARRFLPFGTRSVVLAWLGYSALMRDEPELALERTREALRRRGAGVTTVMQLARDREVRLLVRLGRIDEARACFDALGGEPKGEALRLAYYTTELYLAFAEGRHSLDDDTLHERAKHALSITVSTALLAGLAWAFERSGDDEMAELLACQARDRPRDALDRTMPELAEWLDARGAVRARVEIEDEALEPAPRSAAHRERRA